MANKKISELTSATTPLAGTEVLPIVQSGTTYKVTVGNLTSGSPLTIGTKTATVAAPANISYGEATFDNGTIDPLMFIGYNVNGTARTVVYTEPSFHLGIEGNYDYAGIKRMEMYFQYQPANMDTPVNPNDSKRIIFWQIDRDHNKVSGAGLTVGTAGLDFNDDTASTNYNFANISHANGLQIFAGSTNYTSIVGLSVIGTAALGQRLIIQLINTTTNNTGFMRLAGGSSNVLQIAGTNLLSMDFGPGGASGTDANISIVSGGRILFNGASGAEVMRLETTGNMGINGAPDANKLLDLKSTTKAFAPPRMTTTQKTAIASPTAGMVVYDTTLNKLCVYTTTWETITSGA